MTRSWTKRLPDCKTCRPVLQEGNSNRATARGESHTDGFRTGVRFPSDPPKESAPHPGVRFLLASLRVKSDPCICRAERGKYQDSRHPIRFPFGRVGREAGVARSLRRASIPRRSAPWMHLSSVSILSTSSVAPRHLIQSPSNPVCVSLAGSLLQTGSWGDTASPKLSTGEFWCR